jgi:predicted SAM-dependent methyltransferase
MYSDLANMEFKKEKYDVIYGNFVLGYLSDLNVYLVLRTIFNCLKDNGVVAISESIIKEDWTYNKL